MKIRNHYTSYEVMVTNPLTKVTYWLPRHERDHRGEWVYRGACTCGFETEATLNLNEARKGIKEHRATLTAAANQQRNGPVSRNRSDTPGVRPLTTP